MFAGPAASFSLIDQYCLNHRVHPYRENSSTSRADLGVSKAPGLYYDVATNHNGSLFRLASWEVDLCLYIPFSPSTELSIDRVRRALHPFHFS